MYRQKHLAFRDLRDLLNHSFNRHKEITALKLRNKIVTYGELQENSLGIANFIFSNGLHRKNIGIFGQRNLSVYYGIVGTILAGATYVPINSKFPLCKKLSLVQQASIEVIICSYEDYLKNIEFIQQTNLKFIIIPDCDHANPNPWLIPKNKLSEGKKYSFKESTFPQNKIIYIMFTSGSTGTPKGVKISHSNVLSLINNLKNFYPDLEPGYHNSQTFDLSFDPSICDMFFTWSNGGTLCILSEKELYCPSEYIKREKIVLWHSVPALAEFIQKLGQLKNDFFPSIRYSIFTGEPCKKSIADSWMAAAPNSTIENRYGPTEVTVDCLRYSYRKNDQHKFFSNNVLPIGTPYDNLRFAIINENLEQCSTGDRGELIIAGPQVSEGYLNDEKKTNSVFTKMLWDREDCIWYRTGDSAFVNQDDQVECLGRIDNQIKLAGKRMELEEIEYHLINSKIFSDVIVVPLYSNDGIVHGVSAFTTTDFHTADVAKLKELTTNALDQSFFPKKFERIDAFPRLSNGKIDRKTLETKAQKEVRTQCL
ncbi:MAG: AMP-binding protein [Oligoflexia bacterium]|nr:AMP-binding protein [Oligoflexia bacterium]